MKHTKATIEKMRQSHRGKSPSQGTRDKISKALRGRTLSKATRLKMRKAKLGKPRSEETKQKLRDIWAMRKMLGYKGKKMSPQRLRQHVAMLRRKKPWLSKGAREGLKKAIAASASTRSLRAMLKGKHRPKSRWLKAYGGYKKRNSV